MKCPSCGRWVSSFDVTCFWCGQAVQVADGTKALGAPAAPVGTDAVTVEPSATAPEPAAQVIAELRKPRKAWYANLAVLVLTVGLFVGIGTLKDPLAGTLTLVAALAVHELGHWLAMKVFRYSDVQVFFIPLLGAAASGQPSGSSRSARPFVDLAGALLGTVAGVGAAIAFGATGHQVLREFARTSLILSLFNLVPLSPLDGGRFLRDVLLVRNPTVEAVYQGIAGAALVLLAVLLRSPALGLLGAWSFFAIRWTMQAGRLTRELAPAWTGQAAGPVEAAPDETLGRFIEGIHQRAPAASPSAMATRVRDIWDRIRTRPPKAGPTIGLLALYLVLLATGFVAWVFTQPRA